VNKTHITLEKEQNLRSTLTSSTEWDDSASESEHTEHHHSSSRSFGVGEHKTKANPTEYTRLKVHLFTWTRRHNAMNAGGSENGKDQSLKMNLEKPDVDLVYNLLLTNPRVAEREVFLRCRPAAYERVKEFVKNCRNSTEVEVQKVVNELVIPSFEAFEQILEVFLPMALSHDLVTKYWGVVLRILKMIRRSYEVNGSRVSHTALS
jgi:hypothetical protein